MRDLAKDYKVTTNPEATSASLAESAFPKPDAQPKPDAAPAASRAQAAAHFALEEVTFSSAQEAERQHQTALDQGRERMQGHVKLVAQIKADFGDTIQALNQLLSAKGLTPTDLQTLQKAGTLPEHAAVLTATIDWSGYRGPRSDIRPPRGTETFHYLIDTELNEKLAELMKHPLSTLREAGFSGTSFRCTPEGVKGGQTLSGLELGPPLANMPKHHFLTRFFNRAS